MGNFPDRRPAVSDCPRMCSPRFYLRVAGYPSQIDSDSAGLTVRDFTFRNFNRSLKHGVSTCCLVDCGAVFRGEGEFRTFLNSEALLWGGMAPPAFRHTRIRWATTRKTPTNVQGRNQVYESRSTIVGQEGREK